MLEKIINSIKKHHAILVEENINADFNYFFSCYAKSLVCDQEIGFCDHCMWCQKINNKSYYDIIFVDGFSQKIKKEDIQEIILRFSHHAVEEKGIKIYAIKSIENATQQSLNSLLKFLEEPPKNTYAVFSAKNINSVLGTIISRTQYFSLPCNESIVDKRLEKFDLSNEQKQLIKKIYSDVTEMENALNNNSFQNAHDFCKSITKNLNNLEVIKKSGDEFKKFDYEMIKIILRILMNLSPNNEKIFALLNDISFNPIRILLYCKIIEALNENNR